MICDGCNVKMLETSANESSPYRYTAGGLENVFLCGITVYKCAKCGMDAPVIPRIGALHRAIAADLTKKSGFLFGDELRFLRKNAGLPANSFAALLGVTPSHLSRVENGKRTSLSESADKLVRLYAAVSICGEDAREAMVKLGRRLAEKKTKHQKASDAAAVFTLKGASWQRAA